MRAIYPDREFVRKANANDPSIYSRATENWIEFWEEFAKELEWFEPWEKFLDDSKAPYYRFFVNGKINACYNCVDRHADEKNKLAIIWESENEESRFLTYYQLHREVNTFAKALKSMGVKKGTKVAIYMPNVPEAVIAMLACARIGATHVYIFEGFGAKATAFRLKDSRSNFVITADGYYRRGQLINLKDKLDEALKHFDVKKVIVVERAGIDVEMKKGRDVFYKDIAKKGEVKPEILDANHPLFIMYTSGSTAEPKGIVHSTGGYLVNVYATSKIVLDLKEDDILWTTASLGWITGHSYIAYGPLAIGSTVLLYEGAPDYPNECRTFEMIDKYGVTVFYTVPTLVRMLKSCKREFDLSSLRLIGTVGEPIDPETWFWLYKEIGKERIPVVNTWWQTETGGHVISPLPALTPMKAASVGKALPGFEVDILDEGGKSLKPNEIGNLVIKRISPGFMLELNGDPRTYISFYWSKYGKRIYFSGDSAYRDKDGYIWIVGRIDEVLNISGHRISLVEIEHNVMEMKEIREVAAIGLPDRVRGNVIALFVISDVRNEQLGEKIMSKIENEIGKIARPALVVFTPELPRANGKVIKKAIYDAIVSKKTSHHLANPKIAEKLKKIDSNARGIVIIE